MIIVRLNERVSERGVGRVANGIERLKIRINRLAKLSNANHVVFVESHFFTVRDSNAGNFVADNVESLK
jgi:hypothetical protein